MKSSGFSLLETMIALGLATAVLFWTKDQVLSVFRLQNVIQDHNYLQSLEQDLRLAILDEDNFQLNKQLNKVLESCVEKDQVICPDTGKSIPLVSLLNKPVTGGFPGRDKACTSNGCPVQVEVLLSGACQQSPCDVASVLIFDYTIAVDGDIYRHSFIQKFRNDDSVSDQNSACVADAQNRTGFAYQVQSGQVNCVDPIRPKQSLTGVNAGACKLGTEILSGFSSDGKVICKAISWE